jgi:hypothetical protein
MTTAVSTKAATRRLRTTPLKQLAPLAALLSDVEREAREQVLDAARTYMRTAEFNQLLDAVRRIQPSAVAGVPESGSSDPPSTAVETRSTRALTGAGVRT